MFPVVVQFQTVMILAVVTLMLRPTFFGSLTSFPNEGVESCMPADDSCRSTISSAKSSLLNFLLSIHLLVPNT